MAKVRPIGSKSTKRSTRPKLVHQFLIVLSGTDPLIWRRLQVPERYSFWDLHVAIQDAMGWLDYHLHEFRLLDRTEKHVVSSAFPRMRTRKIGRSLRVGRCLCRDSSSAAGGTRRRPCMPKTSATTGSTWSCTRAWSQPRSR